MSDTSPDERSATTSAFGKVGPLPLNNNVVRSYCPLPLLMSIVIEWIDVRAAVLVPVPVEIISPVRIEIRMIIVIVLIVILKSVLIRVVVPSIGKPVLISVASSQWR